MASHFIGTRVTRLLLHSVTFAHVLHPKSNLERECALLTPPFENTVPPSAKGRQVLRVPADEGAFLSTRLAKAAFPAGAFPAPVSELPDVTWSFNSALPWATWPGTSVFRFTEEL